MSNVDEVSACLKNANILLSAKITEIAARLKSNPNDSYTGTQVYDLLTELAKTLAAPSCMIALDNINDEFDELEERVDREICENCKAAESMHTYVDFVLDKLPDSASLADREEIKDALNQCECFH